MVVSDKAKPSPSSIDKLPAPPCVTSVSTNNSLLMGTGGAWTGNRGMNIVTKRGEQLKSWQDSITNKESSENRSDEVRKVKFTDSCVFLAACASGDQQEVGRLLDQGADVNTTNVDGMTALHQAVIDENMEMIQYLVEVAGADINAQDNEGWTPLHAAAASGYLEAVKYLLAHGADMSIINCDDEIPLNVADMNDEETVNFLTEATEKSGIDVEEIRSKEEHIMLQDAMEWQQNGQVLDRPHPRTGATALHVAAAKGYIRVLNLLIQAGAKVNVTDKDGWTPLHAAAHWNQHAAAEVLTEHMADFEARSLAGETPFDVADPDEIPFLEHLQQHQAELKLQQQQQQQLDTDATSPILEHPPPPSLTRKTSKGAITRLKTDDKHTVTKVDEVLEAKVLAASGSDTSDQEEDTRPSPPSAKEPKIRRLDSDSTTPSSSVSPQKELSPSESNSAPPLPPRTSPPPLLAETETPPTSVSSSDTDAVSSSLIAGAIDDDHETSVTVTTPKLASPTPPPVPTAPKPLLELKIQSRPFTPPPVAASPPPVGTAAQPPKPAWQSSGRIPRPVGSGGGIASPPLSPPAAAPGSNAAPMVFGSTFGQVSFPNSNSVAGNGKNSSLELLRNESANEAGKEMPPTETPQQRRFAPKLPWLRNKPEGPPPRPHLRRASSDAPLTTRSGAILCAPVYGTTSPPPTSPISKIPNMAAVSPVFKSNTAQPMKPGDSAERESERKMNAKRARETRRSTQGVTMEQIQDARQFLQQKPTSVSLISGKPAEQSNELSNSPADLVAASNESTYYPWRQREIAAAASGLQQSDQYQSNGQSAAAAAAAARRRLPRQLRRPTGPVSPDENGETEETLSGVAEDKTAASGPTGYRSSTQYHTSYDPSRTSSRASSYISIGSSGIDRDLDYKKLYEEEKAKNAKLQERIRDLERQVDTLKVRSQPGSNTRHQITNGPNLVIGSGGGSLSDKDRRTADRRVAELEEEVKLIEQLRSDNQRLKEENGALIRVISKLSK